MDEKQKSGRLVELLWRELRRKNESQNQFTQRIKDCYFPLEILDSFVDIEPGHRKAHENILFLGNLLFLSQFKSKAKSRFRAITNLVHKITALSPKPDESKNFVMYHLLVILTQEKRFKKFAQYAKFKLSPKLRATVTEELDSVIDGLQNLNRVFKVHKNSVYQRLVRHPVKEKATELGFGDAELSSFIKFLKEHKNTVLATIKEPEDGLEYAKRSKDYMPNSRDAMTQLFNCMKDYMKIPAEKAKRYIADLFNFFEIRTYMEIRESRSDEKLSDDDVCKDLAKRIGDVIHKQRT